MSDMDNDELKATRRLNGADKYSEADEMFEKLGYKKEIDSKDKVRYTILISDVDLFIIEIWKLEKVIWFSPTNMRYSSEISLEELQAINKKYKELGWM